MNIKAFKLYGEDLEFCQTVNLLCGFIEEKEPETFENEEELFQIALEETYDFYMKSLEQKRENFKRYRVLVEVQIDRELDPAKFFEAVFTHINGIQHSLCEVLEIEEIPF
jgi:hypothetical protein